MLAGVIEKRPWALIAAWIVIALLLAQYAAQLDNVMKTETREFLPPHVESVRAEKELNKLYNQTGAERMEADYLVMVHGVPVSLETYYRLKPSYMNITVQGADRLSWIDIVASIEQNISAGMSKALNGSLTLIGGATRTSQGYRRMLNATTQMHTLLQASDQAYTALARNATMLASESSNLTLAARSLALACTFQRLEANMLFNVVRAEALLENLTGAYQNMTLSQADIARVVAASNLSQAGIQPLTPEIVAAVFNATMSVGGPSNWSNALALQLARSLALEAIAQAIGESNASMLQEVFDAAHQGLAAAIADTSDLRLIVLSQGTINGQAALLQAITQAQGAAEQPTIQNIAQSMATPESKNIMMLLANKTLQHGCNPENASTITRETIAEALASAGVQPTIASQIASDALDGKIDNTSLIAQAAISIVLSHAGQNMPPSLIGALEQILTSLDPTANATLTNTTLGYAAAAALALSAATGEPPSPQTINAIATNTASLEDAAYQAYILMLQQKSPRAMGLAIQLHNAGLLGASNESILSNITVLATILTESSNGTLTQETARALLAEAVKVYSGEEALEEAVSNLTRSTLEQAWPGILERVRGVMVEKDLNGFLVLMVPHNGSLEENVRRLQALEKGLGNALESAGFTGYELIKGGTSYMTYEMREAVLRDVQRSDRMSMVFVLLVMALVLESIAAVILPFTGIGLGLLMSMAFAYFLAKAGVIDVTSHSRTIMYSTGLGLGIDYAVYVSRSFREAARQGLPSRRAAAEAYRRSWRPVLAGATTAMIGFGSMILAGEFSFISSIGATVPLTIFMVMLASITFIPALLAYVGEKEWFWWPRHPLRANNKQDKPGLGERLGSAAVRAAPALLVLAIVLGIAGYWIVNTYQGSYDISLNLPEDTESYKFIHSFNSLYDPGVLYPVYIVASSPSKAAEINKTVAGLSCVSKTRIPEGLDKVVYAYTGVNPLSYEGVQCAEQIRNEAHKIDPDSLVGGMGATNLDLRNEITSIFYGKVYPVAIALMFLTMLAAYGGAATALAAVLSVVAAAYLGSALSIIVYEHIRGLPVLWYLPVITFTAILGVGMDYNSFYLARARAECDKECSKTAVARSIGLGAPIVLGLATIMASAYLGLSLTKTPGIASMGLALLMGVLFAGLYASMLLTPPIIALLGRHSWWPKKPRREVSPQVER